MATYWIGSYPLKNDRCLICVITGGPSDLIEVWQQMTVDNPTAQLHTSIKFGAKVSRQIRNLLKLERGQEAQSLTVNVTAADNDTAMADIKKRLADMSFSPVMQ